jgi:hypothetical protein
MSLLQPPGRANLAPPPDDDLAALLVLDPVERAARLLEHGLYGAALDRAIASTRIGPPNDERALAGATDRSQVALTMARLLSEAAARRPQVTRVSEMFHAFDLSGLVVRSVHDALAATSPQAAQDLVMRVVAGLETRLRIWLCLEHDLCVADQDDVLQTVAVSLVRHGLRQYLALSSLRVYVGSIAEHAALRLIHRRLRGLQGEEPDARALDVDALLDHILRSDGDRTVAYKQMCILSEFLRDRRIDATLARFYREMMAAGRVPNHPYPEPGALWALLHRHVFDGLRLSGALVRALDRLKAGRKRRVARLYFLKGVPVHEIREALKLSADAQVAMPLKRAWLGFAADAELVDALRAIEAEITDVVPDPEPPDLPPGGHGRDGPDRQSGGSRGRSDPGGKAPPARPEGPASLFQSVSQLEPLSAEVLEACADLAMITENRLLPGDLAPGVLGRIIQRLDVETVLHRLAGAGGGGEIRSTPTPVRKGPRPRPDPAEQSWWSLIGRGLSPERTRADSIVFTRGWFGVSNGYREATPVERPARPSLRWPLRIFYQCKPQPGGTIRLAVRIDPGERARRAELCVAVLPYDPATETVPVPVPSDFRASWHHPDVLGLRLPPAGGVVRLAIYLAAGPDARPLWDGPSLYDVTTVPEPPSPQGESDAADDECLARLDKRVETMSETGLKG